MASEHEMASNKKNQILGSLSKKYQNLRISYSQLLYRLAFLKKKIIWVFSHEHARFTEQQGKGEFSLTPLYHFHLLHKDTQTLVGRLLPSAQLCTQPATGLERKPLVSECKSLTTNLRALKNFKKNVPKRAET